MRTWWDAGQVGFSSRFKNYIDQRLDNIEVDGSDADRVIASFADTN